MHHLLVLLLAVAAVHGFSSHLDADHVHDQDYPYGMGLKAPSAPAAPGTAISSIELEVSADANDLRMDDLQAQLNELQTEADKISIEAPTVWPWVSFIYLRFGNNCDKGRFQCSISSDEVKQCVSNLAVCDGITDCKNGNDEDKLICRNHMPLGSSWAGDLDWMGCEAHRSKRLYMVVTRVWNDFFMPSVQKIAVTLVFTWVEVGLTMTNTVQAEGRYYHATHSFELNADPNSHLSADITCSFTDDNHCHGVIFQATTGTLCGRIILIRSSPERITLSVSREHE